MHATLKFLWFHAYFCEFFRDLKSRAVFFAFEIKKSQEQNVAGTKSRGTKSRVELIVAQNFKTKSRGNLMSRKIRKQKVAGTKSREVAQYFCATISSRDFLFPRLFVPIRYLVFAETTEFVKTESSEPFATTGRVFLFPTFSILFYTFPYCMTKYFSRAMFP